ncbi:putative hydrolase, NUDIX family [Nocardia nova SH22a]|uniref:8-oxo-dGTP diphosphatase n=1 Tax=Nocardia nova SH22a TaxID=1415166 RepID=W5TBV6_9NOCA|nr:NUDIX domain-containing protein [Nocardia nova]AHH16654.1 putative hydrolase, NUDIX family [Nocardia nova SH22a]
MISANHLRGLEQEAAADGIDRLVVGAVIRNQGNVLLLERPVDDFMGGIWELPSGKVEPGEKLDAALAREVAEETGLTIETITSYLGHFDYLGGSGSLRRQLNFAITVGSTEPVILTEHVSYQWASLDGKLPVTDSVREVLRSVS